MLRQNKQKMTITLTMTTSNSNHKKPNSKTYITHTQTHTPHTHTNTHIHTHTPHMHTHTHHTRTHTVHAHTSQLIQEHTVGLGVGRWGEDRIFLPIADSKQTGIWAVLNAGVDCMNKTHPILGGENNQIFPLGKNQPNVSHRKDCNGRQ